MKTTILAIETSCDDTCAAVVEASGSKIKVLSNIISSQVEIHKKWGGVYPSLAKREHQKNLPLVVKKALGNKKIDAIAVTVGPGLDPCLWTGINFANDLAKKTNKPLIPVNHIEAHILANFINKKIVFPALALIISGGHTQLILMKKFRDYEIIGETRDDAAGECFDKTARILGLEYPGGPIISAKAEQSKKQYDISLPRPMILQKNYDFSFSGLKTAVLYDFKNRKNKEKTEDYIKAMCKEIQKTIIEVLLLKTTKAAKDYRVKTLILGGGVASNKELQKQFKLKFKELNVPCIMPERKLCTDNAVMVAVAGLFNQKKGGEIKADSNLRLDDNMLG